MAFPLAAAASLGGGLLGFMGQKSSNDANMEAAEYANTPRVWEPVEDQTIGMLGAADQIFGQQGFAPGPNPLELQGRQTQLDYGQSQLPGMVGAAQGSWMQGLNPGMNPYVPQMIDAAQNNLLQQYQRSTMPGIDANALSAGQYGGSRQAISQGIANEGLMESMGQVSTGLLNNAYNQAQNQQQAAWGQAGNMLSLGLMPGSVEQDIGGQYRADQALPGQNVMQYAGLLQPWSTPSTGGTVPQLGSTMGGAIGGGMAGLGLYDQYQKSQAGTQSGLLGNTNNSSAGSFGYFQ